MLLGVSPLAFPQLPPLYLPWQDPACLSFVYAGQAGQTIVSSRTTVLPNLKNPAQTYTVPATFQGPTIDTSIGGQPTWVADATLTTTVDNNSIALPNVATLSSSTTVIGVWALLRGDASASGFSTLIGLGSTNYPGIILESGGAGISLSVGGIKRTVTSGAGYTQGTAKRVIALLSGNDANDFIKWGSVSSGAGGTSTQAADTGGALFARGNNGETSRGAIGVCGMFAVSAASSAARLTAANALFARWDAWAAGYYGATPWAALVS